MSLFLYQVLGGCKHSLSERSKRSPLDKSALKSQIVLCDWPAQSQTNTRYIYVVIWKQILFYSYLVDSYKNGILSLVHCYTNFDSSLNLMHMKWKCAHIMTNRLR